MSPRRPPDRGWGWLFVLLLTVFAVAPLTYPGFFQAQSGFLPVFNATHPADAPHWGQAADPVRGEGKLPYLLIQPLFRLTGSGVTAVKAGYALAFLLGALGLYAWARRWLGPKGGLLAAVVYTYLPWHLSTVYGRGAYAEAWLWAWLPFLLWAIDRLADGRPRSTLWAIAVGLPCLAAAFWSQAGSAALAASLLVAYSVIVPPRRLSILSLPIALLLPWFVAGRAGEALPNFIAHPLYPYQLFSAAWGEGLSFQLGLAAVGLSIVAVALTAVRRAQRPLAPSLRRAIWFWLGALLLILFLVLPVSSILWRTTPLDALLTRPWQLLALTGLPLAFLSGAVLRLDRRLATLPVWAGLTVLVVLTSYFFLAPDFTQVDPGPEPVALLQPVEADAPQILLLETEIAPPTEITPTLTLTLTWQAVAPVSGDYTVFVHLLTAEGEKIAQRDSRPCNGDCPTDAWPPGEIIIERHELILPPEAATDGPDQLALGLYLLQSGQRAAIVGNDDQRVILHVP